MFIAVLNSSIKSFLVKSPVLALFLANPKIVYTNITRFIKAKPETILAAKTPKLNLYTIEYIMYSKSVEKLVFAYNF